MSEKRAVIEGGWTPDQWRAITEKGSDLLVAAAAGSGKTAVLVERMIKRMIDQEQPVDVNRLLVVTFTNASAAEMKHRIGQALEKELLKQPNSSFLRRQLALLQQASISTLHQFCLQVLRKYYYSLELDPKFRMMDGIEADLLKEEVLEQLLEEKYAEGTIPFFKLVDCFSSDRHDKALQQLILEVFEFSRSHPSPTSWLTEMANFYNIEDSEQFSSSPWMKEVQQEITADLSQSLSLLERGLQLTREPAGPAPYADNFIQDKQLLEELQASFAQSWEAAYASFQSYDFKRLKPCRGDEYDKALMEQAKSYRTEARDRVKSMTEKYFSRSLQEYIEDMQQMAAVMEALVETVLQFGEKFAQMKKERAVVDFSDLEHFCLEIFIDHERSTGENLAPSAVALEYQQRFAEVLVDEYQDTNLVQEAILLLVSKRDEHSGNLFMVGDVKQSIYRFRLAEPGLFLHKYKLFAQEQYAAGRRINLAKNFRSRPQVLEATNYIFKQIMNEQVGEMEYDPQAELAMGAAYPESEGKETQLLIIDKDGEVAQSETEESAQFGSSGDGEQDQGGSSAEEESVMAGEQEPIDASDMENAQLEAKLIAQQIKELIGSEEREPFYIYDTKRQESRPITYKDIVILMRSTAGTATTFMDEFKRSRIPAYADLSTGYFEATEVTVMLSLLKIIDNPRQDIPLVSVLRSPIVDLTAEELAQIRVLQKKGAYYDALLAILAASSGQEEGQLDLSDEDARMFSGHADMKLSPEGGSSGRTGNVNPLSSEERQFIVDVSLKLTPFFERLQQWRGMARQGSLADLIWHMYRETSYFDYVGGIPGGKQRQANLRALYDRARQYEETSYRGLFRFLRFIERLQERGDDLGTARALGEQEDVVRLMTIHKSKGLEFPVVFIAGLTRRFNSRDVQKNFLLHKELGFGSKFIDPVQRINYPTLAHQAIKQRIQMELLAEEMRVLYVAMTRAKEKLYLVGTLKNAQETIQAWTEQRQHQEWILSDHLRAKARSYLEWIGPAIIRHKDTIALSSAGEEELQQYREISEHASSWKVEVIQPDPSWLDETEEVRVEHQIKAAIAELKPVPYASSYQEEIEKRLSWSYAYPLAEAHLVKQSVSEIKRQMEWYTEGVFTPWSTGVKQPIGDQPRFLQEQKLTPAERGTAMHIVMQHLSLRKEWSMAELQGFIAGLEMKELMTEQQTEAINVEQLVQFSQSSMGERLRQAEQVYKEVPFTYGLPAEEVYADWQAQEQETILIQGVIDCLIEEEDGLILLDYKTDAIGHYPASFEEARKVLQERYQVQITLYAKALESIWQKPVKEKYLYFFDGGHLLQL